MESYITQFSQPDTIIPSNDGNINSALVVAYHELKFLEQLNQENHQRISDSDTEITKAPSNPLAFNRYSYSYYNPLTYSDPDGHFAFLVPLLAGAAIGGAISAGVYLAMAGPNWTGAGLAGAVAGGAVAGAVSVIATPLAGTLLHAAGAAATGTALTAGTAAVNAAGGALSYLAGGYTENITNVIQGNTPVFQPTASDAAVSAAIAGAISPAVGKAFPVSNSTMSTLKQANYFMAGRTARTLLKTQNARNLYGQAGVATGTGVYAYLKYLQMEEEMGQ